MKIKNLLIMTGLHFIIMFFLMYSMLATFNHFYFNINKIYMAAIMTSPMVIIEVLLMGSMYKKQKHLIYLSLASVAVLTGGFYLIRTQGFVEDKQFLRSMIPHHSSAILMCEQSNIKDKEIIELCDQIVETQKEEIKIMKTLLEGSSEPEDSASTNVENFYTNYLSQNPRIYLNENKYKDSSYLTDQFKQGVENELSSMGRGAYDPILCAQDSPESIRVGEPFTQKGKTLVYVEQTFNTGKRLVPVEISKSDTMWKINDVLCDQTQPQTGLGSN